MRTLDHAIETLGRRPVRKLDAPVLASLRLGAYQLGYLDVAPHAAANESVELVRAARLERAVPFTNAVMRRLAEGMRQLARRRFPKARSSTRIPTGSTRCGAATSARTRRSTLMRAQNEPPETVVRLVRGDIDGEPTDVPGAYRVARVDEQALGEGRIWPQSRGSQVAALAVGARDGERVLDSCAAPGGKATMLHGDVTAVELNEARARELEENVRRLGATNVHVVQADATTLPPELDGFDRALVDAPCSGLGVLAARPDLRWRARPLPELQARIASRRGRACQGGRLRRLQRLHAQRRRERSGRRRLGPRAGRDARRRVAAIPASAPAGVPAHAAARPPHERLLHRAVARAVSRGRYAVAAVRIIAAGGLALAAVVVAVLYEYVITISAGLCGDHASGWVDAVAVGVPLIVVGSWGLLHGWWILVAWPAAVLAAAACLVMADYLRAGAHGYCETMTPYERILSPSRYSTMSIEIVSSPRAKVTASALFSATRQPASSRL